MFIAWFTWMICFLATMGLGGYLAVQFDQWWIILIMLFFAPDPPNKTTKINFPLEISKKKSKESKATENVPEEREVSPRPKIVDFYLASHPLKFIESETLIDKNSDTNIIYLVLNFKDGNMGYFYAYNEKEEKWMEAFKLPYDRIEKMGICTRQDIDQFLYETICKNLNK